MQKKTYKIRSVSVDDAAALLEIYRCYVEKTAVTFEYETPTEEEFRGRIEKITEKYPYICAEDENGTLLGYAYAAAFKNRAAYDWSVETTIYIRKDMHRQGLGKALYEELEKRLRAQGILNMNACVAVPREEDEYLTADSVKFHTAMGFAPVGTFHYSGSKFGRWYDMIWLEKMLGEHAENPQPVRFRQG